jgi:hypothetical protein
VDPGNDRASGVCDDSGINPMNMKFPFEVEPAPLKTIVASLWACFKYACDCVCGRLGDHAPLWDVAALA